jgi:hypothetical protein
MTYEAQILFDNSAREFNKMDSTKQVEMIVHIKKQLKSHYDGVKAIGLGMAKCYVEAGEKFIKEFDK